MKKCFQFSYRLKTEILSILAYVIINFVSRTSKIIVVHEENLRKAKDMTGNVIYAFWHGRQFLLVFTHRYEGIIIMSSLSKDGDLQTGILSKFGYKLVRGSSGKRGAVEGTLELMKRLENGEDLAFAVDGPAGPRYHPKLGTLYLSQKTGKAIVPLTTSAKRKKIFSNWDKYLLPYPFNKCVVVYGNPMVVRKEDDLNKKTEELEKELNRITEEAGRLVENI